MRMVRMLPLLLIKADIFEKTGETITRYKAARQAFCYSALKRKKFRLGYTL